MKTDSRARAREKFHEDQNTMQQLFFDISPSAHEVESVEITAMRRRRRPAPSSEFKHIQRFRILYRLRQDSLHDKPICAPYGKSRITRFDEVVCNDWL